MKTFHVANWSKHYENNRSRKIADLRWVPIPNAHDGEKYTELITRKDGPEIFAAWILILQVASRCAVRGTLVRSNGHPHDAQSISLKTRAPAQIFEKALPFLESIGWLTAEVYEQPELELERHSSALQTSPERHAGDEEGKGMEENRKKGTTPPDEPAGNGIAESIYALYPRKVAPKAAFKAIHAALRVRTAPFLTEAVEAYAMAVSRWRPEDRDFVPHPATWFNAARYDDDRKHWEPKSHANDRKPNSRQFSGAQDYSGVTSH